MDCWISVKGMVITMNFHILTLFPEMVINGLNTSIIGKAIENDCISINAVNIRDYTLSKHKKVDDYPYGGGAGMLMQAQPVYDAFQSVMKSVPAKTRVRTIYVTPWGTPFNQSKAKELAQEDNLIFLCGHYEGIDERVLEEIVTDYVSIGDYVLTGGELPAMVMIDAISRFIPGVLNNEASAETESFHNDLLEYPQYSRPETWNGEKVPDVLLSGNHQNIQQWRLQKAEERTKSMRPDLYKKYQEKQKIIQQLSSKKRDNIHLIELLKRGNGDILYAQNNNYLIYDNGSGAYMITIQNPENQLDVLKVMFSLIPKDAKLFVTSQEFINAPLMEFFSVHTLRPCFQASYTQRESLPVLHKDIRILNDKHLEYVKTNYSTENPDYIKERIDNQALYGAFEGERIIGFIGMHNDGSIGILFVDENYRKRNIGTSLEAFLINKHKEAGWTPYGAIYNDNQASLKLQEKIGLNISNDCIWWVC